jgi:hypothetical protein
MHHLLTYAADLATGSLIMLALQAGSSPASTDSVDD